MGLLDLKRSNALVTITISHRRPHYPKGVEFMNIYNVKNDPELDLKAIFYEAFNRAHPDWSILEIKLQ